MINLDENYWTNRYQQAETGWDIGAPSRPLKEFIDTLQDTTLNILIPGAGNAYEARYLFDKGFNNVVVLDISNIPLQHFSQRYPDFPSDQLIHQDFFEHQGKYDLILEQTFFCALTKDLRSKYALHMSELLNPGGRLCGVLFDAPMNEDQPPFGGSMDEYRNYFSQYFEIEKFESCTNSISPRAGKEMWMELRKKN